MYRLIGLQASNFLSFKEFTVDLSKPGIWIISGFNEPGGDSNGCGKSAIFSAISWCLFGRTSKGETNITSWHGGEPEVTVVLADESKTLHSVTRTSSKLEVRSEHNEIIKGSKTDVQKIIYELFKSDFPIFINSTLWAQGSTEFFASSGDVDKKRLLKSIMKLEAVDKGYDKARRMYDDSMSLADKLTSDINHYKSSLESLSNDIKMHQQKEKQWHWEWAGRINALEIQCEEVGIQDKVSATKEQLTQKDREYQRKVVEHQSRVDKYVSYEEALANCNQELAINTARLQEVGEQIRIMITEDGSKCPVCGSIVSRKTIGSHKKELLTKKQELMQKISSGEEASKIINEEINDFIKLEKEVHELKEEIMQLQHEVKVEKQAEENRKRIVEVLAQKIQEEKNAVNPYTELSKETNRRYTETNTTIAEKENEFNKIIKKIDYLAYIKWLLSREGVASFIIEQSYIRLERLTNFYMSKLCSEGFLVEIKPQRELKSKALKEEIDIIIRRGKHKVPYWNLSDGQRQRLNIALLVAIYRLCRDYGQAQFDFLLLDEVLDLSLASKGQEDVIRFMKEMLAEIYTIIVISHKENISSNFDHEIIIRRKANEISYIESHG